MIIGPMLLEYEHRPMSLYNYTFTGAQPTTATCSSFVFLQAFPNECQRDPTETQAVLPYHLPCITNSHIPQFLVASLSLLRSTCSTSILYKHPAWAVLLLPPTFPIVESVKIFLLWFCSLYLSSPSHAVSCGRASSPQSWQILPESLWPKNEAQLFPYAN